MAQKYTHVSDVPLSLAVFLASDSYDYNDDPNTVSATTLLKPLRQIILGSRISNEQALLDLTQMVPSRIGTAIHDAIENAWKNNYKKALSSIGVSKAVIETIRLNPSKEELNVEGVYPVYLEQRHHRKIGKWTISGKYDIVIEGKVEDFKTTSVYTYIKGSKESTHTLQGSIYRWLSPDIITADEISIQYIFTDWSAAAARSSPDYPQTRFKTKTYKLLSLAETEKFIKDKLSQIEKYWDAPEEQIPHCSDEDLWRSEPIFKYYKNPEKTSRSTKNFDTKLAAMIRLIEDGSKGIVVEKPGEVSACKYCKGFPVCSQKDQLIAAGDLNLT